jgi:hypothetical protein
LQLIVVQVSAVGAIFSTVPLGLTQWLITGALALLPLVIHELEVLIRRIFKK